MELVFERELMALIQGANGFDTDKLTALNTDKLNDLAKLEGLISAGKVLAPHLMAKNLTIHLTTRYGQTEGSDPCER